VPSTLWVIATLQVFETVSTGYYRLACGRPADPNVEHHLVRGEPEAFGLSTVRIGSGGNISIYASNRTRHVDVSAYIL
jgi:hypothetical protein